MSQVFRIATRQAILEIIQEGGALGRFGLILSDEALEQVSDKIVDLFEITLDLRAKTQGMFAPVKESGEYPQIPVPQTSPTPFTLPRRRAL